MITVIGSLKGGSGKSTITFNLAIWLAMAERNVAVIDADPQATLTDVLEVRREEGYQPTVEQLDSAQMGDRRNLLAEHEDVLIDVYEVPQETRSVSVSLDRVSVAMEEPRDQPVGRLPNRRPASGAGAAQPGRYLVHATLLAFRRLDQRIAAGRAQTGHPGFHQPRGYPSFGARIRRGRSCAGVAAGDSLPQAAPRATDRLPTFLQRGVGGLRAGTAR